MTTKEERKALMESNPQSLRESAISKLTEEEKAALGIGAKP